MDAILTLSKYDLVAAALQSMLVFAALTIAIVYLMKRSGNHSSNVFFALLITAFALSLVTLVFEHLGIPARDPTFRYLPLWLTWTFGPSWFYYVKFSLFPAYRFRWTDMKHFIFPIGQVLYHLYNFWLGRTDFAERQLFGIQITTIEEFIFLVSVTGYLFAGYRYLRYRASEIGDRPLRWDYWKVKLLRRSQRVIFVLLTFNFVFVAFNFTQVQVVGEGLLHIRSFYASSSLSFGLILLYLLRGVAYRQHFFPQIPHEILGKVSEESSLRLDELIRTNQGFRDPDLHRVRVARAVNVAPEELDKLSQKLGKASWWAWIQELRFAEVARLRKAGRDLGTAALEAGFASKRSTLKAFRKR